MKIFNKTSLLLAVFITAVTFSACDKKKTLTFDKTFEGIPLEVPPTNSTGKQASEAVVTGIQKFAEEKDFDMNDITKVKPTKCTVTIKDTSTVFARHTFDELDYVGVFIYAINLNKMEMGSIVPPKNGSTSVELTLGDDLNLADYVKLDQFYVYAEISNNDTITHKVPLEVKIETAIEAEVTTSTFKR